ncbi:MAG: TolC family protein [Candidatus Omnitrophica bacterium]|nr:TolC family protein [Candidatus Omnitrophota bacterium]
MDIKDFSKRMIELLPQCIRGFHSYESNYLSRGRISQPQFWALEYLSRRGPSFMSVIASFLNVSRPAATGLIDRLIAQRLVSRRVGEDDRRSVKVEITSKGKRIVSNIWEQKRRSLEKVFSKISPQDRRQHLEILERVVKTLGSQIGVWLTGLILVGSLMGLAYADEPLSLKQCYQLALKRSETIAIDQQVIKEAEGQFWQSLSGILPQVNYAISQKWQDGSGDSAFTLKSIPERKFTFTQPLFSGFKEFAAIAASKAQHRERESQLERAKQLLFTDTSDAFYYLQNYQEDLQALEDIHNALVNRVAELERRWNLGRSRQSEVASAQASLYKNEADQEGVHSQLEVARQLLEFLIGQPVTAIKEEGLPNDSVTEIQDFISRMDRRPDVEAAKEALNVAQKNITIARAGFWPSVSVNGDSYTKRVGNAKDVNWDVTLNVNVPIFNGTQTMGQVKQAQAQAEEAKLTLSQTKRSAVLDIQNAYTKFMMDQKKELAIQKAYDAGYKNYRLQEEDYSHNLVNNLDVLQALQDWESFRRDYIAAKNETKRFYWNLKVAAGDIGHDAF